MPSQVRRERTRSVNQSARRAKPPSTVFDCKTRLCFHRVMAQKTYVQLVDDLDGTELGEGEGETVSFAIDGTDYEIDLSRENADKLRGIIYDYSAKARKVSGGRRAARRSPTSSSSTTPAAEIRAWARDNGHDVPERGRVPSEVREAFFAAN